MSYYSFSQWNALVNNNPYKPAEVPGSGTGSQPLVTTLQHTILSPPHSTLWHTEAHLGLSYPLYVDLITFEWASVDRIVTKLPRIQQIWLHVNQKYNHRKSFWIFFFFKVELHWVRGPVDVPVIVYPRHWWRCNYNYINIHARFYGAVLVYVCPMCREIPFGCADVAGARSRSQCRLPDESWAGCCGG